MTKFAVCLARGTEVLFVATSDCFPVIQQTDVRATDSCFDLIAPHQCGVLMAIVGWLAASVSTPSRTLVVSTEAGRGYQSLAWLYGRMENYYTVAQCVAIITGDANLARSIKIDPWSVGLKSYLWWIQKQPVIQPLPSLRHTDEVQ